MQTTVNLNDDAAFEQLFRLHYQPLLNYANIILNDLAKAEEIVQNVFMRCWEKREILNIQTSVKAYLYKCVYHDSLNLIKHEKVKLKHQEFTQYNTSPFSPSAAHKVELSELQTRLSQTLNSLPEQCRSIFQMSRFEELKYKEIADNLDISIKTVEKQMGKALKILRTKLADFLILVLMALIQMRDFFN